ncbi:VanZ family protein [Mesonia mobilis]|uniref:VanZ family protein n=1 Tax=Mesonia mobilis TaxID=369791 RepID=UPI0026EBEBB2|nr:VanZ family protein [Mesonia mobilis]
MKQLIKNLLEPKLALLLSVVYTLVILVLSLINLKDIPAPKFEHSDKYMHTIAYFGLTLIWYMYYFSRKAWLSVQIRSLGIICLLIIAFGIFIEILQDSLTTYRTIDSLDMLANSLGVLIAFSLIFALKTQLKKVKSRL